jgi:serine/threonine-protein phosphatase 2A regulatory subunit B'
MPKDLSRRTETLFQDDWEVAVRVKNAHDLVPLSRTPTRRSSSRFNLSSMTDVVEVFPAIKAVAIQDREALFLKKVEQCKQIYDFVRPNDIEGKEAKRKTLIELLEYLCSERPVFSDSVYSALLQMIAVNLFRTLSPQFNPIGDAFDPEEDEPVLELAWPHLHVVYELFIRWLESPDFDLSIAKQHIDIRFVSQLVDLFGSEDPREREMAKSLLHRIYCKLIHLRSHIRRQIGIFLTIFTYDCERPFGIAELLEILASIINGFALPMKDEHKQFLFKILLPLHKGRSFVLYQAQLTYCIGQYFQKDPSLGEAIVRNFLRYWPKMNSSKEVLFLNELEEFLIVLDPIQFRKVQHVAFQRLARCMISPHFQVAERSLLFWANQALVRLIQDYVTTIFPIVYGALYKSSRNHWNRSIMSLSTDILKAFMDMDQKLYDDCAIKYDHARQTYVLRMEN